MTTKIMMLCGHAANAVDGHGQPCCLICSGIQSGAHTIVLEAPDLAGRKARCSCGKVVDSSTDLPFFEFRGEGSPAAGWCKCGYALEAHGPNAPKWRNGKTGAENRGCSGFEARGPWEFDTFYCGCRGWD